MIQAERSQAALLQTGSTTGAIIVDNNAGTGKRLYALTVEIRTQGKTLTDGAAAVTAEADAQHAGVFDPQDGGIEPGMYDHGGKTELDSAMDMILYNRTLSRFCHGWVNPAGTLAEKHATQRHWKMVTFFDTPAHTVIHHCGIGCLVDQVLHCLKWQGIVCSNGYAFPHR
jgi:hypothetical protein